MAKVGFIGVGNMGGPMVRNLLKAQHSVQAFDLSAAALAQAAEDGATASASMQDAVREVDIVVTMLPAGQHVRDVYLGEDGLIAAVAPGTLLIDSSTIDVDSARAVQQAAEAAGFDMIDSPVSGGVGGAEAATLTFMCGGSDAAFERARHCLEAMGKNIVHAGGPGNGQVAKVCNNMILGTVMSVTSEAFVLAEKLGLDHQKLFDVVSTASGQSWVLNSYCPVPGPVPASPANRDYQPGFTVAMMTKDLRLAQEAAQRAGAATPMGSAACALYSLYESSGHGALDFSAIVKLIRGSS